MNHQAYLERLFEGHHICGTLNYFCAEFAKLYCIMAEAQVRRLTPGELVTAYELADVVIPEL